jgi:release factor glutamine methyltransferase
MASLDYSRAAALAWAQAQLVVVGQDDSPKLDADLLLCHQLECASASLYAWPEKRLTDAQWQGFSALVEQRS